MQASCQFSEDLVSCVVAELIIDLFKVAHLGQLTIQAATARSTGFFSNKLPFPLSLKWRKPSNPVPRYNRHLDKAVGYTQEVLVDRC